MPGGGRRSDRRPPALPVVPVVGAGQGHPGRQLRDQAGISPRGLLDKMVRGEQVLETLRLIEGWNWRQVRAALAAAPHLRKLWPGLSDADLMAALGGRGWHLKGASSRHLCLQPRA